MAMDVRKIHDTKLQAEWQESDATAGRFGIFDIVEADQLKGIGKATMIMRAYRHADTETLFEGVGRNFWICFNDRRSSPLCQPF